VFSDISTYSFGSIHLQYIKQISKAWLLSFPRSQCSSERTNRRTDGHG